MKKLHNSKQHYVPIVDPGIKIDPGYSAYDRGLKGKVFINDLTGDPYVGQVNPASVIWRCATAVAVLNSTCVGLGMPLMPTFLLDRCPSARTGVQSGCRLCTCLSSRADHTEPALHCVPSHMVAGQTPFTGLLLLSSVDYIAGAALQQVQGCRC